MNQRSQKLREALGEVTIQCDYYAEIPLCDDPDTLDDIIAICQRMGLKFVEYPKIGKDDYISTVDDYRGWEKDHPPVIEEIEV